MAAGTNAALKSWNPGLNHQSSVTVSCRKGKRTGKTKVLIVGKLFILPLLSTCLCPSLPSQTRNSGFLQRKKLAWLLLSKSFANLPDYVSWWSGRRTHLLFLYDKHHIGWFSFLEFSSVFSENVSLSYLHLNTIEMITAKPQHEGIADRELGWFFSEHSCEKLAIYLIAIQWDPIFGQN